MNTSFYLSLLALVLSLFSLGWTIYNYPYKMKSKPGNAWYIGDYIGSDDGKYYTAEWSCTNPHGERVWLEDKNGQCFICTKDSQVINCKRRES